MLKACGYEVFDVWNLKHVYCGSAGNTDIYRHGYIDNIDLTCVSYLEMRFETNKLTLRYDNPFTHRIESILSRKPDSSSPDRSPLPTDIFMTNTNNKYEFLWLDSSNSTLYAGIYHSTEAGKAPQYVYNVATSSPYTDDVDPTSFNDINAANDVEIVLSIKDHCNFASSTSKQNTCPDHGTPTVHNTDTYIEVPAGESVTIDCSYTAYGLATNVEWTFKDKSGVSYAITAGINVSKYSGSTVHIPSLTVKHFGIYDEGIYKCAAINSFGTDTGVNIQLVMIQASTVILTDMTSEDLAFTTVPSSTLDRTSMKIFISNDKTTTKRTTDMMPTSEKITTETTNGGIATNVLSITTETTDKGFTTNVLSDSITTETTDIDITTNVFSTSMAMTSGDITSMQGTTQSLLPDNHASSILPPEAPTGVPQCACSCEYRARLDYWRNQTVTNYTMDELRLILSPKLKELEDLLKVDKQNISSYLNRFLSAPDDRVSSQSIGAGMILLLVSFLCCLVLLDLTSIKRHLNTCRRINKKTWYRK
ncbi:uncharacterized protein LOC134705775 [Mytilus trossulus]|uniref:uncharacterized protein LOC134705775 n=1 Tax=Mytilus trossulus TaxID=6551 RepID=UPI003007A231